MVLVQTGCSLIGFYLVIFACSCYSERDRPLFLCVFFILCLSESKALLGRLSTEIFETFPHEWFNLSGAGFGLTQVVLNFRSVLHKLFGYER